MSRKTREFRSCKDMNESASVAAGDMETHCCSYCPKMFIHPKYVIRHMICRHSEMLLTLHDQYHNLSNCNNKEEFMNKTGSGNPKARELKPLWIQIRQKFDTLFKSSEISKTARKKQKNTYDSSQDVKAKSNQYRKQADKKCSISAKRRDPHSSNSNTLEDKIQDLSNRYNSLFDLVTRDIQLRKKLPKAGADSSKFMKELEVLKAEIATFKERISGLEDQLSLLESSAFHKIRQQDSKTLGSWNLPRGQSQPSFSEVRTPRKVDINPNCDTTERHNYDENQLTISENRERKPFASFVKNTKHKNTNKYKTCMLHFKRAGMFSKHNPNALGKLSSQVEAEVNFLLQRIGVNPESHQIASSELPAIKNIMKKNTKYLHLKDKDYSIIKRKVMQQLNDRTQQVIHSDICEGRHGIRLSHPRSHNRSKKAPKKLVVEKSISVSAFPKAQASSEFVAIDESECGDSHDSEVHAREIRKCDPYSVPEIPEGAADEPQQISEPFGSSTSVDIETELAYYKLQSSYDQIDTTCRLTIPEVDKNVLKTSDVDEKNYSLVGPVRKKRIPNDLSYLNTSKDALNNNHDDDSSTYLKGSFSKRLGSGNSLLSDSWDVDDFQK